MLAKRRTAATALLFAVSNDMHNLNRRPWPSQSLSAYLRQPGAYSNLSLKPSTLVRAAV
jgi:cytochrome c2